MTHKTAVLTAPNAKSSALSITTPPKLSHWGAVEHKLSHPHCHEPETEFSQLDSPGVTTLRERVGEPVDDVRVNDAFYRTNRGTEGGSS